MTALEPRRTTATIATELRREVEAAETNFRSAVQHAIRAGELLIEAKSQLGHGEWLPWLEANFPGSERTAQNYMRMARKSACVADLPSIRDAIALLAEPQVPPTGEIKAESEALRAKCVRLHEGGAHTALDYDSWADYCAAEFGDAATEALGLLDIDGERKPPEPKPLKDPATGAQVSYLRDLSERAGTEPPAGPVSKARASTLIDQLRDGSTATAPAAWLAKLRKLVEEIERAELTAPDIAAAQPLAGRLARAVGLASTTAPGRLPAPEWTDDELQALVDSERAS